MIIVSFAVDSFFNDGDSEFKWQKFLKYTVFYSGIYGISYLISYALSIFGMLLYWS